MVEESVSLLTNHAYVLLCIGREPDIRVRDLADEVGITERAAQRIVAELADAGCLTRQRNGRRNKYQLETEKKVQALPGLQITVGDLLGLGR